MRIRVRPKPVAYDVTVAPGLIARAGSLLRRTHRGSTAVVVTDRTVDRLHGARLVRSLASAGFSVRRDVLPVGERAKSDLDRLEMEKRQLEQRLRTLEGSSSR